MVTPLLLAAAALMPGAAEQVATVSAVGDLMIYNWISAPIYQKARAERPADPLARYRHPFERVRPWLTGLVIGNLEGPLTSEPAVAIPDKSERFFFSTPPRYDRSFHYGGFDILSVANNHMMDCGPRGLADTLRRLQRVGILAPGAGPDEASARRPALVMEGGLRIAILAYCLVRPISIRAGPTRPGVAWADQDDICADVKSARARADAVLVFLHWGREVTREQLRRPPSGDRVALARAAIDAGAAAVLGCHAHAVEDIERYRSGVIFYGLGNFVFAGTTRELHPFSMIARLEVTASGVRRWDVIPVLISPSRTSYQPRLLTGAEREGFLRSLVIRGETPAMISRVMAAALALADPSAEDSSTAVGP